MLMHPHAWVNTQVLLTRTSSRRRTLGFQDFKRLQFSFGAQRGTETAAPQPLIA